MDKDDLSEFRDEVKRLAADLLTNETLVAEQVAGSREQILLFYGHAGIGGDTIGLLNDPSPRVPALCSSLLSASASNRRAVWNFILKALS